MSHPRILIVDDDPCLLTVLPDTLSCRLPHVLVDTCESPHVALSLAQRHEYHAIVCDVKMPGMDGIELVRAMKQLCPHTPLLMISGHVDPTLTVQAIQAGAYDFIMKPIDRDLFTLSVQRAMEAFGFRGTPHDLNRAILCVEGLPVTCTVGDLKVLFAPYGTIAWARLIVDANGHTRVFGYVEMASTAEAEAALIGVKALAGTAPMLVTRCTDVLQRRAF